MLYYFNIHDDADVVDHEGIELDDMYAAFAYAAQGIRSLAAESVLAGHLTCHHRIDILDGQGTILSTVRFDEAVDIRP